MNKIIDAIKKSTTWNIEAKNEVALRLWYKKICDPYKDKILSKAPDKLIVTFTQNSIKLYKMITGETFSYGRL